MGANGRNWVHQAFGWQGIAADMIDVYRWLKDGRTGAPPATVRMD